MLTLMRTRNLGTAGVIVLDRSERNVSPLSPSRTAYAYVLKMGMWTDCLGHCELFE